MKHVDWAVVVVAGITLSLLCWWAVGLVDFIIDIAKGVTK